MIIKVCGLKYPDNIKAVAKLPIDMLGFIFYEKSPRSAKGMPPIPEVKQLKTGVFVNSAFDYVMETVREYGLDCVQLHGNESPGDCLRFKAEGLRVMKAFGVAAAADLEACGPYEGCCDLFVFDSKTQAFGGSGRSFDHSLLNAYRGKTPFLLSGGISVEAAGGLFQSAHPMLAGFDLNSRFETSPGIKDPVKVKRFVELISGY